MATADIAGLELSRMAEGLSHVAGQTITAIEDTIQYSDWFDLRVLKREGRDRIRFTVRNTGANPLTDFVVILKPSDLLSASAIGSLDTTPNTIWTTTINSLGAGVNADGWFLYATQKLPDLIRFSALAAAGLPTSIAIIVEVE